MNFFLAIIDNFCDKTILGKRDGKLFSGKSKRKLVFVDFQEALVPYLICNARLAGLLQLSKKDRARYTERNDLNKELKRILDEWNDKKLSSVQRRRTQHDYTRRAIDETLTDNAMHRENTTSTMETSSLSQAEIECSQPKWPDLYDDYLEIVVQFGYIIFLSTLFPLAAFFCLLNNFLEIRSDAFKMCMIYQRPFSQRVKGIGHWQVSSFQLQA